MKSFLRKFQSSPEEERTSPLTVIELFQSQGCNSCPPTNANLISQNSPNALLLTYHVTYWDYLGWTDTFGNHAFDARQRAYVKRLNLRSAFTPQVIVNGRASGVGNTPHGLESVIRNGQAGRSDAVKIDVEANADENEAAVIRVSARDFDAGATRAKYKLDVWIVRYESLEQNVHIKRGENAGRVLPHRNVVRSVENLGEVGVGNDSVWTIGREHDGLKRVILVQHGIGGPVVGAVTC